jgi:glutamate-1-semialdehyde aminotransferase
VDRVAGITSTGSKRSAALFGAAGESLSLRMTRSAGCRVWDSDGREYLDYLMGLGAVALGYAHPEVTRAVAEAAQQGVVGPLPPVLEEALAADLCRAIPWLERVRFLKTGAEAMAAAVRLARVVTGRDAVLGCGYHGWLDWCQTAEGRGVPAATRALYGELPFNDPARTRELIRAAGDRLAAVVFEPVILEPPSAEWIGVLREETLRTGAILVCDEIKTVCRLAVGGGCERYGIRPDLVVMGKAIANGLPGGRDGRRGTHLDLLHPGHGDGRPGRVARDPGGDEGGPRARAHCAGGHQAASGPSRARGQARAPRGARRRPAGNVLPGVSGRAAVGTGSAGLRGAGAPLQAERLQLRLAGTR